MILRMSQSSQASPLTSWQACSSLITWGKVRDPRVDPSSLMVEQWLGFGAESILPLSLPGSRREWQGQKHLDSLCSCGCAEVECCKPSPWEHLLLSPLLLLPKFHPVGL